MGKTPASIDPIDQYSQPIGIKRTRLTQIFSLPVRAGSTKPGRELSVLWDKRKPLVNGFANHYTYMVFFKQTGNTAGNHYHKIRQEIMFPILGTISIVLENITSKTKEIIHLTHTDHQAIFVPSGVAHSITANVIPTILLVTATAPGYSYDEFHYQLTQPQTKSKPK